jgi:8-oxo-dGTP pyrophosphatase MutT (NUDIX family)
VVDELDRVLMLRRYRFLPDRTAWELPGGIVDDGEDPGAAAGREVEEETGWRPRHLRHVVTFEPQIGTIQCPHELFLGRGADQVGPPTDVEEAGQVKWIPLADVPAMLAAGELAGSGTLVAVLHLLAFGSPGPVATGG